MATNENAIREFAYYLWQQAGCPQSDGLQFWLAAEQEYACHGDMTSEDADLGKGPDGSSTRPANGQSSPKRQATALNRKP